MQFPTLREPIERLIGAALAAVDPYHLTRHSLRREGEVWLLGRHRFYPRHGRLFLVATGKAAVPMAHAAAHILGDALHEGIVITKRGHSLHPLDEGAYPLRLFEAGHPVPDEASVAATAAVLEMLAQTTADDTVLCLISGGTSALLSQPRLPLADWQTLNKALLASGATIQELNSVRQQLDEVKGGGLARAAAPATCITLILSDVVGNPLSLIGSGPTIPNPASPERASEILARHGLLTAELTPLLVKPTPLASSPRTAVVVGDVSTAARAAAEEAQGWGWETRLLTTHLEGEAREVGKMAAALAKGAPPRTCLILGGETTVTLGNSNGKGGRNTELALAAGMALEGVWSAAVASFATDGDDGNSGAAGAIVTGETMRLARQQGLDPLDFLNRHDSGTFFAHLPHTLLQTGPTGTNVNDLLFVLRGE